MEYATKRSRTTVMKMSGSGQRGYSSSYDVRFEVTEEAFGTELRTVLATWGFELSLRSTASFIELQLPLNGEECFDLQHRINSEMSATVLIR